MNLSASDIGFGNQTVNAELSYEITNTVTDYSSNSETKKFSVACEFVEDAFATSIWQFVVVSPDGHEKIKTKHYMCRYNEISNVAPVCPYNACDLTIDHFQCEVCKAGWQAP